MGRPGAVYHPPIRRYLEMLNGKKEGPTFRTISEKWGALGQANSISRSVWSISYAARCREA